MAETKNPGECDGCGFETKLLERCEDTGAGTVRFAWLCELCRNTLTGNTVLHPGAYASERATLRTICYVGNVILRELRAMRPASF